MNDFVITITRIINKNNFSRSVFSLDILFFIDRLLWRSIGKHQKVAGISFLLQYRDSKRKISNKIWMFYFYQFLSFQKILLRQSDAMKVCFRFVFSNHISNCVRTQWSRIGKGCPCSRLPSSSHFRTLL